MTVWRADYPPPWLNASFRARQPRPYGARKICFESDTLIIRCQCQDFDPLIKMDVIPLKRVPQQNLNMLGGIHSEAVGYIGQCQNCDVVYWRVVELCGREDWPEYPEDT